MSKILAGRKILVTRPREQGERLCSMIESDGGIAIAFPTLELSLSTRIDRRELLELFGRSSHVIFVSRNAVRFANRLAGDLAIPLRGKTIIAVGDGTQSELEDHQLFNVISPGVRAGSEELLDMPALSDDRIRGRHILIVRGHGGRELLARQLQARGAQTHYANVYERSEPAGASDEISTVWRENCPDVIVFTSEQGLQNLIRMTPEPDRVIMFGRKLVVISPRLAEVAGAAGFLLPAAVATEQSDRGLLQAIRKTAE